MGECLNECISSWRLQAVHFSKTSSPPFACKSTESSSTPHSPSFGSLALLRCVLRSPSQGPSLQSQALKFSIDDHLSAGQWCPLPRWLPWKRQEGQQSQQFRTSQLFLMERGQGGNTGESAGGEGRACSHPSAFQLLSNFTHPTFQTLRTRHKEKPALLLYRLKRLKTLRGALARSSKDTNS